MNTQYKQNQKVLDKYINELKDILESILEWEKEYLKAISRENGEDAYIQITIAANREDIKNFDNGEYIPQTDTFHNFLNWTYQTGDNSFSGSCYFYDTWGVGYLYSDTDCLELAKELFDDLFDNAYW